MYNFKGVIFDLDGTIANTMPDLNTSMNEMLAARSLPLVDEAQLLKAINFGARQFVCGCLPKEYQTDEDFVEQCLKEYDACYARHYMEKTVLYPGIKEVVLSLRKRGLKLAVLSNKQDNYTKAIVEKLFDDGTFDIVMGQTHLPTKPDPVSAFTVAGRFDLRPSEIVFIGDSHVDIETAKNAGMYAVGVSWGYRPPEFLVEVGAKKIVKTAREIEEIFVL